MRPWVGLSPTPRSSISSRSEQPAPCWRLCPKRSCAVCLAVFELSAAAPMTVSRPAALCGYQDRAQGWSLSNMPSQNFARLMRPLNDHNSDSVLITSSLAKRCRGTAHYGSLLSVECAHRRVHAEELGCDRHHKKVGCFDGGEQFMNCCHCRSD